MLGIQKIIAAFLTLPGLYLTLTLILSIYTIIKSKSRFIKLIALITIILMTITFTGLGVRILLFPLENNERYMNSIPDIEENLPVVVLGGGIYHGSNNNGTLSSSSLQRLVKGYKIYKHLGSDSVILYSGGIGVGREGLSEAEVAENWLKSLEIKEKNIIMENKARTTYENGLYVKEWLESSDYEKIYLVTSAVHMKRAAAVFQNLDIKFIPVTAGYLYSRNLVWTNYIPNRGALRANMSAIHEWVGILWYLIRGYI